MCEADLGPFRAFSYEEPRLSGPPADKASLSGFSTVSAVVTHTSHPRNLPYRSYVLDLDLAFASPSLFPLGSGARILDSSLVQVTPRSSSALHIPKPLGPGRF